MILKVLATGSSGNCYLLQDEGKTLILDAGINFLRIIGAIENPSGIVGCLVTHEHQDHAKAACVFAARGIETYASKGTWNAISEIGSVWAQKVAAAGQRISIDGFTILPFETQHDAAEPLGFVIRCDRTGEQLVYATDTYYLKHTFPGTHYWLVECNYCDDRLTEMMEQGEISIDLRNRLTRSHLSLNRLKDALKANDLTETRLIVLCHLSDQRSHEERMIREINELTGVETVAASPGMTISLNLCPF